MVDVGLSKRLDLIGWYAKSLKGWVKIARGDSIFFPPRELLKNPLNVLLIHDIKKCLKLVFASRS